MASPTPDGSFSTRWSGNQSGIISIDTTAGDWVYLSVAAETVSVSGGAPICAAVGVSSDNLKWFRRSGAGSGSGIGAGVDCWAAYSPTALTGESVFVLLNNSIDDAAIVVACFSGATGFDTNADIPSVAGSAVNAWPSITFDTTKADCTLIGSGGGVNNAGGAPSGWTSYITEGNGGGVVGITAGIQYQQVSAPQAGAVWAPTSSPGGNGGGIVLDALTSDTLPTPPTFPGLVGQSQNTDGGGGGASVTLTTTAAGEILVAVTYANAMDVVSVIGASLGAFSKRGSVASSDSNAGVELWHATATGALTGEVIAVVTSAANSFTIFAFGVEGSTGFDSNGSLPATGSAVSGGSPSLSYSTTGTVGLAIGVAAGGNYINGDVWNISPGAPPPGAMFVGAGVAEPNAAVAYGAVWILPLNGAQSGADFPLQPADTTRSSYALLVDVLDAGTPTEDATGSGNLSTITISAPEGNATAPDDATGSGNLSTITLSAPAGAGSVDTGFGELPTITITAPVGRATGEEVPAGEVVSGAAVLVLGEVIPGLEVSSAGVLILAQGPPPPIRMSSAAMLALGEIVPGMRMSQAAVLALVDAEPCVTQRCDCWIITCRDGTVFGFTSHDVDVLFKGVTCKACQSLTSSASEQSATLEDTGNVQIAGMIDSTRITEQDLYAGKFDDAFVEVWRVTWGELYGIETPVRIAAGWAGNTEQGEQGFTIDVLGPGVRMGQKAITTFFAPTCRFKFGDPATCGIDLATYGQAGQTVVGVGNRNVIFTDITDPGEIGGISPQWNNGTILWTSGLNEGITCETQTVDFDGGQIVLWVPAPYLPEFGDQFTLFPGCDHGGLPAVDEILPNQNHGLVPAVPEGGCLVYDNIINFGGFNLVPGPDAIIQLPASNY